MFPSPFGVIYFSMNMKEWNVESRRKFPSPFGVIYFSIDVQDRLANVLDIVSVPFRGYLFLNDTMIISSMYLQTFPSPFGVIYFSMISEKYEVWGDKANVSVPFRGYLFLNWKVENMTIKIFGFRPLSGLSISQWKEDSENNNVEPRFPSPFGVIYFSMGIVFRLVTAFCVSVPFRGYLFLNKSGQNKGKFLYFVSVPFRGYLFLNAGR